MSIWAKCQIYPQQHDDALTPLVFSHDNLTMTVSTTKSATYALPPPASRLSLVPSHRLDVFCPCGPCRQYRVLRVDAFCEGLLAGLEATETAIDGPAFTGTMSGSPATTYRPPAVTRELTPTRRPPGR